MAMVRSAATGRTATIATGWSGRPGRPGRANDRPGPDGPDSAARPQTAERSRLPAPCAPLTSQGQARAQAVAAASATGDVHNRFSGGTATVVTQGRDFGNLTIGVPPEDASRHGGGARPHGRP
ncbi:hypothetical protein GCM10027073_64470 [Streptomyces chlorus]